MSTEDRSKIPLFNFDHSVKYFVDLFVLVLFGLANAGVDVTEIGPVSAVTYLATTIGKTTGIAVTAWALGKFGFKPTGLDLKSLLMVGYIASIGLTVSLFVSGAAFNNVGQEGKIQSQAKIGVLIALFNGAIAYLIGQFVDFSAESEADATHEIGNAQVDDLSDFGLKDQTKKEEEDDEFLEHVIAIEYVDRLKLIHHHVKEAEEEAQLTRRDFNKSLKERLKEMELETQKEEELLRLRTTSMRASETAMHAREAALRRRARQSAAVEEDPDFTSRA